MSAQERAIMSEPADEYWALTTGGRAMGQTHIGATFHCDGCDSVVEFADGAVAHCSDLTGSWSW